MAKTDILLQWGLLEINQRWAELRELKAKRNPPKRTALKSLARGWELRRYEVKKATGWTDSELDYGIAVATIHRREALARGKEGVV